MRGVIGLFLCLAVAQTTWASIAERPNSPEERVEVVGAEFGLFHAKETGKPGFEPSTTVPLVPNQEYGWVAVVRTSKTTVKWREEFTLPAKPDSWDGAFNGGKQTISADGMVSRTEAEVSPENGVIYHGWAVAPGDPKGPHRIRLFIEGVLVKDFQFNVD